MEMSGKIHPTPHPFAQRKESCMDPQQFTTMANKFQSVRDEEVLNERGKHLGFATRERLITPFRLSLSVIASMATQHVQTIADLHRQFNELWALDTDSNAFSCKMAVRLPFTRRSPMSFPAALTPSVQPPSNCTVRWICFKMPPSSLP